MRSLLLFMIIIISLRISRYRKTKSPHEEGFMLTDKTSQMGGLNYQRLRLRPVAPY
jgi:hypothetical protein